MYRHLRLVVATAAVVLTPALANAQSAWRQPIRIAAAGDGQSVAEPDGGAVVVWFNTYRLRLTAASAFSPAAEFAPNCICRIQVRVAQDTTGRAAAIVWRTATLTTSQVRARMIAPDGTLGATEAIATRAWGTDGDPYYPSVAPFTSMDAAVDGTGRLVVALDDKDGDPFAYVRTSGGTWGVSTALDTDSRLPGYFSEVHVMTTSGGSVAVTFLQTFGSNSLRQARLAADGSWTLDALGPVGAGNIARTAISDIGVVSAVWTENTTTGIHAFVASAPAGSALGTPDDLGEGILSAARAVRYVSNGDLVVAWNGPDIGQVTTRRRSGGVWSAPSVSPDMGTVADIGIGSDAAVFVFSHDAISRLTRVWRRPANGSWDASGTPLFNYAGGGINPRFNDGTAAEASATVTGGGQLRFLEYTARPLPVITAPTDSAATRMSGPETTVRGAIVPLCLRAPAAPRLPVVVQRLRSGRWVTISMQTVFTEARQNCTHVYVRLNRLGDARVRVLAGVKRVPVAPITVSVIRPLRPRIAVGTAPSMITAGPSGVWTLEGAAGVQSGRLRQLDPTTGATRRTVRFPGFGRDFAISGGTAWVVSRRSAALEWFGAPVTNLTRFDLTSASVTDARVTGRVSSVDADAGRVWIGGVQNGIATVARNVDASSGTVVSITASQPASTLSPVNVDDVAVRGDTLFLGGLRSGAGYVVSRASSSTGGTGIAPTGSTSRMVAISSTVAWGVKSTELLQLQPTKATRYTVPRGSGILDVAPSGTKAWVLESGGRQTTDDLFAIRLVQLSQRTGAPTGRVIDLGRASIAAPELPYTWPLDLEPRLAIADRIAWVLNPAEGTVMRIPLAQPTP